MNDDAENPFNQGPLMEALHAAVDDARERLRFAGYDATGAVLAVNIDVGGETLRTAAAFPMNDFAGHADLMREGATIFEAAGAAQEPLFAVIQRELKARGWKLTPTVGESPMAPLYEDPEGNKYAEIGDAIMAQTYREIGMIAHETARDVLGEDWEPPHRRPKFES